MSDVRGEPRGGGCRSRRRAAREMSNRGPDSRDRLLGGAQGGGAAGVKEFDTGRATAQIETRWNARLAQRGGGGLGRRAGGQHVVDQGDVAIGRAWRRSQAAAAGAGAKAPATLARRAAASSEVWGAVARRRCSRRGATGRPSQRAACRASVFGLVEAALVQPVGVQRHRHEQVGEAVRPAARIAAVAAEPASSAPNTCAGHRSPWNLSARSAPSTGSA